jgi:hypothetical protein
LEKVNGTWRIDIEAQEAYEKQFPSTMTIGDVMKLDGVKVITKAKAK